MPTLTLPRPHSAQQRVIDGDSTEKAAIVAPAPTPFPEGRTIEWQRSNPSDGDSTEKPENVLPAVEVECAR